MNRHRRSRSLTRPLLAAATVSTAVLATLSSVGSATASTSKSSLSPVTEGVVITYTGPVSFEGGAANSGVYPALYWINKAGGILGHPLTVSIQDTRGDAADAVPIVDKMLATVGNLFGVTGPDTSAGPTVAPVLGAAKVTSMIWAGEASFDRNTDPYLWRLFPPDPANGEAMAIWAREQHYTKVAAVFGTDSGSQGDLPGVIAGVKAIHATLVANVGLTAGQASYRAEVERVISSHPQAILSEADGATAATFFAELKQLNGLVPIIGTSATTISSWINPVRNAIGAADFNKYFRGVAEGTPKPSPAMTAYSAGLKAQASKVPSPWAQWVANPYSGAGYDGLIVQALAATAAHSIKPTVYNAYVMKVTEPGAGKTKVYTYAQGVQMLKQGKQIQYVGVTGKIVFDKYHNSFGDQAVESVGSNDVTTLVKLITAQQVQALG